MTAPNKILIPSDMNELEKIETIKTKEGITHKFKFTKSVTKEGLIMTITEDQLNKNLKQKIFINDDK